ncbi:MAG TPA: hypothetical protein VGO83_12045 [Thermoleophilaceae bacterium]|jgi:hypothetical protein|nr:hypothetical protein [Thermoleophilaceae bacterium]
MASTSPRSSTPRWGIYCFGGLDFTIRSGLVTPDNAGAAIQRGNHLGRCDANHQQARIQTFDVSLVAAVDNAFTV